MFPIRFHHLLMAAALLVITLLLFISANTVNYDLCVEKSADDTERRYTKPSVTSGDLAKVIVNFVATILMLMTVLVVSLWMAQPIVPADIQKSISDYANAGPPERLQLMCRDHFMALIERDLENFLIYLLLWVFFSLLVMFDSYLPENLFSPITPEDMINQPAICCFTGFGIFVWYKFVIVIITVGFASMSVVSVINLYQEYLHLKRNEKMPVAGVSEFTNGYNNAILLNVRLSCSADLQQHNNENIERPGDLENINVH